MQKIVHSLVKKVFFKKKSYFFLKWITPRRGGFPSP
jgi:hypothetical protein